MVLFGLCYRRLSELGPSWIPMSAFFWTVLGNDWDTEFMPTVNSGQFNIAGGG